MKKKELDSTTISQRGRPIANERRRVFTDLMVAAEQALQLNPPKELKIRDIAARAGTNEAMIRYYFGGKDGLLVAMLDDFMSGAPHETAMNTITERCMEQRSIRPLIEEMAASYYSRPNLVRMIIVELMHEKSEIKSEYLKTYAQVTPIKMISSLLNKMKGEKIYRNDIDCRFVVMSIMSLILGPISLPIATDMLEIGFDEVKKESWIAYLTQTIDRTLS